MRHWIRQPLPQHEEINVVFFRGMSLDTLTRGLLAAQRMPLAYGKGTEWGVMMHPMLSWKNDDYDLTNYGPLCRDGGELVVFVTEPCSAKGFPPDFDYHRDGRLLTCFSFEALDYPGGDKPNLLLPALIEAKAVGPDADHDSGDYVERIAQAITEFFELPELDMP
ncbi:hypothetical protein OG539_02260 [Actinacidiphila glaucinigra]|uniref:hypothetical protein n=1 Tax=Actinacidiphila glaucinigra TaxID=235986 RepID=UPI00324CBF49